MGAKRKTYPIRSRLFHAVCMQPDPEELSDATLEGEWWSDHIAADERFFDRMPDLSFEGKSVLDYGCGGGHTCVVLAQRGARRVLGVDLQGVSLATRQLRNHYPELADRVEFRQIASADDIGDERFDIVLSKNSFEHVGDPRRYVADMTRLLAPGGVLAIGFGGLWKSPYGGHVQFMTKLPWSHLLFPEEVILRERKRFRPDEDPTCFEEIRGGLNRMTLGRFQAIMAETGLEPTYFEVNRNDRKIARALDAFSRVPGLREYFAFSVHTVWREPIADARTVTDATQDRAPATA
jgi:SAM-dependent methyltransferase